jgi:putative MATE family efflux protein
MENTERNETHGVNLLRGNPKEAVKKLALPLMLSMMIISLYNIIDSFWVAGLGADQLAAVGFVIPLEFLIISIGTSLGAGISSVVSKYIGEKNDMMADNASTHSMILSIIVSMIVTVIFTLFMKELLIAMGGRGISLDYAMEYAQIYFILSIFVIMPNALYGLLRSEGDSKRTMYVMVLCAIVNMILDPLFIYILNMGMFGAALSTFISLMIVLTIILYWIYIKKDTYLKPTLSNFSYDSTIIVDILKVAVPAICEMIFITFITATMHFIILAVSTTDSVAVFENGWRMVTIATEPMMAISTALISIVAANYGAKNFKNIKIAYDYSMNRNSYRNRCTCDIFSLCSSNCIPFLIWRNKHKITKSDSYILPHICMVFHSISRRSHIHICISGSWKRHAFFNIYHYSRSDLCNCFCSVIWNNIRLGNQWCLVWNIDWLHNWRINCNSLCQQLLGKISS